ncbi:MAG: ATP-binding cassette domain-containing protein [Candidatus Aenigmarchaeota archaeon]|nr:ATP-binding cassette domain-containing protein [Candidatus Aenigmarchaeota archaeon]NIQ17382.1 ATP-binding cassette domain-containing protein [Candidatus Aenigmarchaeota archaeon]NIS73585.1 ATP-binding cassette domain-containing protein [Candidatus Aenigmarchaeota archaeon]
MLIEIQNLSKTYEGEVSCQALKKASLKIEKGDFVSVVGRSGSGKSTLLNCMAGLDIPQEGKVVIDGIDIYNLSEDQRAIFRREYLGMIFQQYHLIPILTAKENVLVPLTFENGREKEGRAEKILEKVGLKGKGDNIPNQLSGGESQRVAIARALINKPIIILADEPTGNLDHDNSKVIMGILRELNRKGQTIIMVTHDMECAKYGNKIISIDDGIITDIRDKEVKNGRKEREGPQ